VAVDELLHGAVLTEDEDFTSELGREFHSDEASFFTDEVEVREIQKSGRAGDLPAFDRTVGVEEDDPRPGEGKIPFAKEGVTSAPADAIDENVDDELGATEAVRVLGIARGSGRWGGFRRGCEKG